jgi:hypothetical protein
MYLTVHWLSVFSLYANYVTRWDQRKNFQITYKYSSYIGATGMLLRINGKFIMSTIQNNILCCNLSFSNDTRCELLFFLWIVCGNKHQQSHSNLQANHIIIIWQSFISHTLLTYLILVMPHGTYGKDKFPPLFSFVGFSVYCAPGVSSLLYFIFDGVSPCCFWSSSSSFPFWFPS